MVRLLLIALSAMPCFANPLRISVYATAGDVLRCLGTPDARRSAEAAMKRLEISRIFLEGRRGDEYVPPEKLREARDYFISRGFAVAGGIATVPGKTLGVRQNGGLSWLNWESAKTQADIARFFSENAPLFDEIIVDDFYCTADTSPGSETARGSRSWGEYRRDLLVGLIEPMMRRPARQANPQVRLTIKYPQSRIRGTVTETPKFTGKELLSMGSDHGNLWIQRRSFQLKRFFEALRSIFSPDYCA